MVVDLQVWLENAHSCPQNRVFKIFVPRRRNINETPKGTPLLVMAALWYTAGHYIFALWFLSIFFFLVFPRLISALGGWMSTMLPHMVWP